MGMDESKGSKQKGDAMFDFSALLASLSTVFTGLLQFVQQLIGQFLPL